MEFTDKINMEKYKLKNKQIIPLDEYLRIDKLPFKASVTAMIEIAFWGQNQSSFKKASQIIKRIHNIDISPNNVLRITKYIGKLVYEFVYKKALEIWNNRAKLSLDCKTKKGTLYIEADGAAVNTRVEDENGSTWKENKLAIFFSDKDIYKRKDKANLILHKEYVSYLGNVDTFRILLFAKAVELEYWKYENIVFISDGATWLRNMISELFPEAIQILDKFHLIENIYEYARILFNDNKKKMEIFKDKIIGYCYSNEYDLIQKELKKYAKRDIPTTVCNLPTYIENNKDKINYSTYEHNNWFVGSGAIESSNKTVVQLRLKQAGMRWSVAGANDLLTLRCFDESSNWHQIEKIVINHIFE